MNEVIGLGAGGHAKVVIETLRLVGAFKLVGLTDPQKDLWNTEVLGVRVLGDDELLPELYGQGIHHAFIGLGAIGDLQPRKRLYEKAYRQGFQIVSAIHPQAIVSVSAEIGHGPTIMAGSIINASAKLGDNVIVNTGAIVEHDCILGSHVHIATGAKLASGVTVGTGVHIGAGATVRQSIAIGDGAIIGAGAVVVSDVLPNTVVVGVPAHPIQD